MCNVKVAYRHASFCIGRQQHNNNNNNNNPQRLSLHDAQIVNCSVFLMKSNKRTRSLSENLILCLYSRSLSTKNPCFEKLFKGANNSIYAAAYYNRVKMKFLSSFFN